jgi:hypothetical protein
MLPLTNRDVIRDIEVGVNTSTCKWTGELPVERYLRPTQVERRSSNIESIRCQSVRQVWGEGASIKDEKRQVQHTLDASAARCVCVCVQPDLTSVITP